MADWETESGLLDKFDGKVVDAWFEETEYGVTLKLEIDSPQMSEPTEQWYGCGSKGVSFVSDKQVDVSLAKNGRFNEQSGVGQLIKAVKENGMLAQLQGKGGPDEAATWKGLEARFGTIEVGVKPDGTPRRVTVPTGPYGGGQGAQKRDEGEANAEAEIPTWLVQLVVQHDDYESFMEAALADDNIDRASRKLVMNEALWDFS